MDKITQSDIDAAKEFLEKVGMMKAREILELIQRFEHVDQSNLAKLFEKFKDN